MAAMGVGVYFCEQRPLGAQDSAHPPALAGGRCSGDTPAPRGQGATASRCSAYKRGSRGQRGRAGEERKNRPAGAEGQAQEKEGPKRPSIYELEKVMIGVFVCVCACVGGRVVRSFLKSESCGQTED